ncbi:unnamed protein product [Rhizoctonia solani]|uniref:Uncharacterized protein n=1 Tax=Rhizoctonia solani TaxID=456999 RepID=A0A8H3A0S6_9AGAM|nr:unnamed protein product [Rhizoctonia solani]
MTSSSSTQPAPSAATVSDDADIDIETIQSTVDMSVSLALGLVQTWMPPASSKPLNQSVIQSRKKLEEYMRRPPRLGVGTPIPTAQNAQSTHHETQKLKNRLVGSGAARRKAEEETKLNSAGSKRPGHNDSDGEDESESRASAMKKKQARAGVNGLSVFQGGKHSKLKSDAEPQSQGNATVVTSITDLSARKSTPPVPTSSTGSPGSTLKTSPEPVSTTEAGAERNSSPPATQAAPDEPMGIHKLPAKLPLAGKIWPQSPPQSKRRKTLAAMLPPPSPSHNTWSMVLPRLPPSRSASESAASSSVPSSSAATEPGPDSTTRLSRKERKRLRKAGLQTETQQVTAQDHPDYPSDRDRGTVSESKTQDSHVPPPDIGAVAMKATSTPRPDCPEADSDDSRGDDEETEEMVSRGKR